MKLSTAFFVFFCFFSSTTIGQTNIIWTSGNNSTDWDDVLNWDLGRLPDSMDLVFVTNIPDSMPKLSTTTKIAGLLLEAGSELVVDTFASMVIQSTLNNAVNNQGRITNYGEFIVDATKRAIGPASGAGAIYNYGLLVANANEDEAIRCNDIYNFHIANIIASSNMSDAIRCVDRFRNFGNVIIEKAGMSGLKIGGSEVFNTCNGLISVTNCDIGMEVFGNFYNGSNIQIEAVRFGLKQQQVGGAGTFTNADDRLLYFDQVSDTALQAENFENFGYLEIHGTSSTVGVFVDSTSEFNNPSLGQTNCYGDFLSTMTVADGGHVIVTNHSERPFFENKLDWSYQKNEYYRMIDSSTRNFLIHVPEIYDSTVAVPLLFMLHGGSGTGTKFYNISGWKEKSEVENFISVYPTANRYTIADHLQCSTRWTDDGLLKKKLPNAPIKNDVVFLRELIDLCVNTFHIDTSRIYFVGFSNGSGMVRERIIPEMADVVTATAGTGSFGHAVVEHVVDSIYLPHWDLFGNQDPKLLDGAGLDSFPMDPDSLMAIPIVNERVQNITTSLQVDSVYTVDSQLPLYNTLQFHNDLSGQGNEYNLTIVRGLEHNFANGTNHPLVYVDLLWPWFLNWTK